MTGREEERESSFPPGCVIICFTVSHVDSDAANRLQFNREKQGGRWRGKIPGRMGGGKRESDVGVEKWKHIVFIGGLSQQQWLKPAGFAISSITSAHAANSPQRPKLKLTCCEIRYKTQKEKTLKLNVQ